MSHFATLKVNAQVKNEQDLVAALEGYFGEGSCEIHDPAVKLTGYDTWTGSKANLVIRRDNVAKKNAGHAYNDLGFERKEDGTYDFHADHVDLADAQRNIIMQDYVARVATRKLQAKGFQVKRTQLPTGELQVVGQVWSP